jgi:membrane protease YdiL (CAAX protease family)
VRTSIDLKRIAVYLAFAFGISWATALAIYLTGGLEDSPEILPGTPITLALVLVAVVYMFSPALSHVLTRIVTREGWGEMYLKPRLGRAWRIWLLAWLGSVALILLGAMAFFLLFPGSFDPTLGFIQEQISGIEEQTGEPIPLSTGTLLLIQSLQALFLGPIINSIFTFGEEFGWRAYLQPKLLPLGFRRAMVAMGVIWGVWHWPLIAMGHNYGLEYSGHPWLGLLAMTWFTFVAGTFIGWLALRGGSVWPAVLAHATINAVAGIGVLISTSETNSLLGPTPVGVVGSLGFTIVAIWLLWRGPKFEEVA